MTNPYEIVSTDEAKEYQLLRVGAYIADAAHHRANVDLLRMTREKMARQLAEAILAKPEFFQTDACGPQGAGGIGIRADLICMTEQQFLDFARRKFQEGTDRMRGWGVSP